MSAFGYDKGDFIPSEISGQKAVDIHHIESRGAGGNPSKDKDRIENLMALTRKEHIKYGDKREFIVFLYQKHLQALQNSGAKFDIEYIFSKFDKYV